MKSGKDAAGGVVLVLGEERFLASAAVEEILARHADLEVTRFSGSAVSVGQVLDEVRTPTLFGAGRAVVVEGAEALLTGEGAAAMAAYAARPVAGTLLVLQAGKLDGRLKASKELKAAASETVSCDPLHARALVGWIANRARNSHGLSLGPGAAEALRDRIGGELALLDAALARLREQIAPRTRLSAEEVLDTTEEQRSPAIFEAASALQAGDLKAALEAVDVAFRDGIKVRSDLVTDPRAIALLLLGNLHKGYARLLRFHFQVKGGLRPADAATKVAGPKAARYLVENARHHPFDRLVERHAAFVSADADLKHSASPQATIEQLLLSLLS